jgi:hypothetical protein
VWKRLAVVAEKVVLRSTQLAGDVPESLHANAVRTFL